MPGGKKVDSKFFNYITPYVVKLSMCSVVLSQEKSETSMTSHSSTACTTLNKQGK